MARKPGSLNERDRAMLRATLASPGTAPAVFTDKNVRALIGADKTCMSCPRCGNAVPGEGGNLCQKYRCDECSSAFAKSTCRLSQRADGITSISGQGVQAIFFRCRHQSRNPPLASLRR